MSHNARRRPKFGYGLLPKPRKPDPRESGHAPAPSALPGSSLKFSAEVISQLAKPNPINGIDPATASQLRKDSVFAIYESIFRLWAFGIPMRLLPSNILGSWWLGPIVSGSIPLVMNGILRIFPGHLALHSAAAWGWLAIFAVTQMAALLAGRVLWGRLMRDMPVIADMLPDDAADQKFAHWVRAWCTVPFQAIAGFGLAALGMYVLYLASPEVRIHLELGLMSYLSVAWTSFMGGLLVYAFLLATLIVPELNNCKPLKLDPWDPATTPGLRTLSHSYIYCSVFITVLAAGLELAATEVPGYGHSSVLRAFVIGFPIFAVLCGFTVMLVPHATMFHLTYVSKMQTRRMIDDEIGDIRSSVDADHGRLVTLVWLRNQAYNTSGIPIRVPWLVPLTAALLGPLTAFLLTLKK